MKISTRSARIIRDAIGYGARCPFGPVYYGGRITLWQRAVWRAQDKSKALARAEIRASETFAQKMARKSDDAAEQKFGVRPNGTLR